MPSGPKKRRAVKNKMATLEVVLHDTVDSFNAEESKLENLGNLNSGNQEDGILYGNDLGSVVPEKKETLPAEQELSVRNEKPPKQDPIFISGKNYAKIFLRFFVGLRFIICFLKIVLAESAPMVSADLAEVLPSPMNDESHQMSADSSGPITATDLNALPPKRCKAEAKEVLPKTAISSYELDQTIPLVK